jgi:hypothetical protein
MTSTDGGTSPEAGGGSGRGGRTGLSQSVFDEIVSENLTGKPSYKAAALDRSLRAAKMQMEKDLMSGSRKPIHVPVDGEVKLLDGNVYTWNKGGWHLAGVVEPRMFGTFTDHLNTDKAPWIKGYEVSGDVDYNYYQKFPDYDTVYGGPQPQENTVNYSKPQGRVRLHATVDIDFILNVPQFEQGFETGLQENRAIEDFIVRLKNKLFQANSSAPFSELNAESMSVNVGLSINQSDITGDQPVEDR